MIKNYFSKKKSKWKAILLTLTILGTLFGIIMYVVISAGFTSYAILTQNKNNKIRTKTTRTYYTVNKYADEEEPGIEGTTSATNGTGLNLMLINNIKTEGYVKEYLQLAVRSQNGELSDYKYHLGVSGIIGAAMAEQGGYRQSGGILPLSCLPWDNSTNSPKWDKSKNITLEKATYETFMNIGYEPSAWINNYVGPFQQTQSYFNGSHYAPSKIFGNGMTSGRTKPDWTYFPDQLSGLDYEVTSASQFSENFTEQERAAAASFQHNVGGSWVTQFLGAYSPGNEAGFKVMINDYQTQWKKYSSKIAASNITFSDSKWLSNFLLLEAGWYLTTRPGDDKGSGNTSYASMSKVNRSRCLVVFKSLGLGNTDAEMQAYLSSKLKNPSDYGKCKNAATQGTLWKDCGSDGKLFLLAETGGHALSMAFLGELYYARMLKYAGVDVDPANPETYMNKYQGEWMPSGDLFWLKEAVPSIDINSVPKKVGEFLNFAKQFLGTPYVWGGRKPGGFDCSGYIQYCVQTHFGGTFGWTTVDQPGDPRVYEVSSDERRIGDFIYIGGAYASASHHVVIYLADAEPGFIWAMHAPQTGDVVKIGRYPTKEPFYYRRLKDYGS